MPRLRILALTLAVSGLLACTVEEHTYTEANRRVIEALPVPRGATLVHVHTIPLQRDITFESPAVGYLSAAVYVTPEGIEMADVFAFYDEALEARGRTEVSTAGAGVDESGRPVPLSPPPIQTASYRRGNAALTVLPGRFGQAPLPPEYGAVYFVTVDHRGVAR